MPPAWKKSRRPDAPSACQRRAGSCFPKEQRDLTHFFGTTNYLLTTRSDQCRAAVLDLQLSLGAWRSLPSPGAACLAAAARSELRHGLEGHLTALLRQGDFVLETALGEDGIKRFGGKHASATRALPHGVNSPQLSSQKRTTPPLPWAGGQVSAAISYCASQLGSFAYQTKTSTEENRVPLYVTCSGRGDGNFQLVGDLDISYPDRAGDSDRS